LAQIDRDTAGQIHRLCDDIRQDKPTAGLWLVGDQDHGKSAVCAYLGQRLFPADRLLLSI
jgi:hypothetical protein